MFDKYSISVIIPVYNEEESINKSFSLIYSFLERNFEEFEIIIVESGSTDNSPEFCEKIAAKTKNIFVYHEEARNGFGAALKVGFKHSTKDLVWIVTTDFPFPIESISQAIPLLEDFDCILSYRSLDKRKNLYRKFQSLVYNHLVKWYLGLKFTQINSAFKLYKREVIQGMNLYSNGWFIDAEILYNIQMGNIKYKEIPVPLINRIIGKSSVDFRAPFSIIKEMINFKQKLKTN